MSTKLSVFLLVISIICVKSLPQYITDVEENQVSNQTYIQSDSENNVKTSPNKRETTVNPSPEATKLAVELLSKAIENILMNVTQMQSIVQEVQTQLVNQGQLFQNSNYQVVLNANSANQHSAVDVGQNTSQSLLQQSQSTTSLHFGSINSQMQEDTEQNTAQTELDNDQATQNVNLEGTTQNTNGQAVQQMVQVSSQAQFGVPNQLTSSNMQSYGQSTQNNVNTVQALQTQSTQNVQQENNSQRTVNVETTLNEAGISSEDQNQGLSTQNGLGGVFNAQQSLVSGNQDYQAPQTLGNKINSNFGQYNQMSTTNVQNQGITSHFQENWAAHNNWGSTQASQGGSQQNFNSAELKPTNTWMYQNVGVENQNSQTNVLNSQQSFGVANVQSSTQNQVQSSNLLDISQSGTGIQNQQNFGGNNQISSSSVQGTGQVVQNNVNSVQDYQNHNIPESQVSEESSPHQGFALSAPDGVNNWHNQNAGITTENSQNNVLNPGQSLVVAGSVQSTTHNQVQSSNLLDVSHVHQGSISQNTGSQINQNQSQQNTQTFLEPTAVQTQQNIGINNQVSSSSVQDIGQTVQNNFNNAQIYQGHQALESSTLQNNWGGSQTVQQGQISQGTGSQQNIAHAGTGYNGGMTNWQYQNAGISTQNSQNNAQQSSATLTSWNTMGTGTTQQGQTNTYQGSDQSGNQGSWMGYTTTWQNQATEGVHQKVQSNVHYSKDQVANQRAKYHFATRINDNINGNYQERNEHRREGQTTGFYSYDDGNIFRTVSYVADDKGYRILSDDIQPSKKAQIPLNGIADVKWYNNGISTEYTVKSDDVGGYKKAVAARGDVQEF